jgi:hypothetical protein
MGYWQFLNNIIIKTKVNLPQAQFIVGVMDRALTSSVVDRGFEPRSDQTKDCKIGVCCLSDKHASLRIMSKNWLARNQNTDFSNPV